MLTVCALDLSETLVRFGISDRTELRFVAPDYFDGLTGPNSASGFDDIAKFPWSKDLKDGWSIGGMASLFWYTEDGRRDVTGGSDLLY